MMIQDAGSVKDKNLIPALSEKVIIPPMKKNSRAILLVSCPDRKGITASVTNFIYKHNGNIVHADQHIDDQTNVFFMRVEWSLRDFSLSRSEIQSVFGKIAQKFQMDWELYFSDHIPRMAIFVSQHLHCLYDLLFRYQEEELSCKIPVIISNHTDAQPLAKGFGIPFFKFSISAANKRDQENKQIVLLRKERVDLIVLARYHQILTKRFIDHFPSRIINIHHSFLPAFVGKNPYWQAYRKGVKIIGATSHFVTEQLDEGPIIEQDIVRISHRDTLKDLIREGQDLEKMVLNRAIHLALERKILCYNNKTVIFD